MAADLLTPAVSDRICEHMNKDHPEAIMAYADRYAGVKRATTGRMVRIEARWMDLEVDGRPLRIHFDHPLQDSEDAHRTLVAMLRAATPRR